MLPVELWSLVLRHSAVNHYTRTTVQKTVDNCVA